MTEDYMVCSPSSMTSTVSKSADIVAGNENGEIETATSFVMLAVGVKGVVDILKNPPVTLSSKLSTLGTISDSGLFYWDFVGYEEDDDDDDK